MSERSVPTVQANRAWWMCVVAAAVVLAATALVVAMTRPAASAGATSRRCGGSAPHLTVQGTGRASGAPDSLAFSAQIAVSASSAQGALAQDSTTTAGVVRAVEAAGVKSNEVQTTDLTINPNYAYANGRSTITGYAVTNSLAVRVQTVADAGAVIDAASSAGGDSLSIGALDFTRSDPQTLEDRAREEAVHQAVTHAGAMARAAGQRLGTVCSLTDRSNLDETSANGPEYAEPLAGSAAVPLEGGTQEANAQVTLVYELVPSGH